MSLVPIPEDFKAVLEDLDALWPQLTGQKTQDFAKGLLSQHQQYSKPGLTVLSKKQRMWVRILVEWALVPPPAHGYTAFGQDGKPYVICVGCRGKVDAQGEKRVCSRCCKKYGDDYGSSAGSGVSGAADAEGDEESV